MYIWCVQMFIHTACGEQPHMVPNLPTCHLRKKQISQMWRICLNDQFHTCWVELHCFHLTTLETPSKLRIFIPNRSKLLAGIPLLCGPAAASTLRFPLASGHEQCQTDNVDALLQRRPLHFTFHGNMENQTPNATAFSVTLYVEYANKL